MFERSHLFDNELPFWLAIGPIAWEATYNNKHIYMIYRTGRSRDVVINVAAPPRIEDIDF